MRDQLPEVQRPGTTTSHSRRSLVVFFVIAFGIPWLGWTLGHLFDLSDAIARSLIYVGDFCSVGGLVAAHVADRKFGLRGLLARAVRFRFSPRWWFLATLIPFAYVSFAFLLWGSFAGSLAQVEVSGLLRMFSLPALAAFLTGPIGEEFGWRGYLLPALFERHSLLTSSLVVGMAWGLWHYPLYFDGIFSSLNTAFIFLTGTVLTSVLMSIIFVHTRGSVLVAICYHWLINVLPITFYRMFHFPEINLTIEVLQVVGKALAILVLYWCIGARTIEERKTQTVRTR